MLINLSVSRGVRAVPRDLEARFEAERKDLLAKVGEVDAMKRKASSPSSLAAANG